MSNYKRCVVKGIVWELSSNAVAGLIVYAFTGQPILATTITLVCLPIKTLLYVVHEKLWSLTNWGK